MHGVYLKGDDRRLGRQLLPLAALNSVTLLGAEVVGRAYGGGVLKLEPREADLWPVPTPSLVARAADDLRSARRRVRDCLDRGRLLDAVGVVDAVLVRHAQMPDAAGMQRLARARETLHGRRVTRGTAR